MGVLDCGRILKGTRITRGGDSFPENLILIFNCEPGSPNNSSRFTAALLVKLRSYVDADNSLVLPGKLRSWRIPG